MNKPFPRRELILPALPPIAVVLVAFGGVAIGYVWGKFTGNLILAFSFVVTGLIALVIQGVALVRALVMIYRLPIERTSHNVSCTVFAAVCVIGWSSLIVLAVRAI